MGAQETAPIIVPCDPALPLTQQVQVGSFGHTHFRPVASGHSSTVTLKCMLKPLCMLAMVGEQQPLQTWRVCAQKAVPIGGRAPAALTQANRLPGPWRVRAC
jgi:hypothetical protein